MRSFVGDCSKLGVGEEGVEDSEVGVTQLVDRVRKESETEVKREVRERRKGRTNSFALLRQIRQLSNEHVDEDLEIVGVEVLLRPRGSEEEVEDFENEKLHAEILRRRL